MGPENKPKKCFPLRRSRKGCMKGKGGPENPYCTYRGVRQRTWGKWVAEIREPNHGARLWLGTFNSSLEAAMAYDAAARTLYGECARLNLPNSVGETPSPKPSESLVAESPVCYSDGVGCIEGDWDDLFVKLPKAEDLVLQAFDTVPPLLDGAGFLDGDLDGELMNFEAWCS